MSLMDEVGGGLDGLSQLRMLMASGRKPGILVVLDFEFVEVESGKAVFAGTPGEHAYNLIGTWLRTLCAVFASLRSALRDACRYLYSHNLGVYEQHMNSSCELHVASFLIVKSRQVEGEFMKSKGSS